MGRKVDAVAGNGEKCEGGEGLVIIRKTSDRQDCAPGLEQRALVWAGLRRLGRAREGSRGLERAPCNTGQGCMCNKDHQRLWRTDERAHRQAGRQASDSPQRHAREGFTCQAYSCT